MPRWVWFVPLGLATLIGALLAFRYGWIAATITETDVINVFALRYITEDGGPDAQASDCIAVPGQIDGAWITVRCGDFTYHANRFGSLMSTDTAPGQPAI